MIKTSLSFFFEFRFHDWGERGIRGNGLNIYIFRTHLPFFYGTGIFLFSLFYTVKRHDFPGGNLQSGIRQKEKIMSFVRDVYSYIYHFGVLGKLSDFSVQNALAAFYVKVLDNKLISP